MIERPTPRFNLPRWEEDVKRQRLTSSAIARRAGVSRGLVCHFRKRRRMSRVTCLRMAAAIGFPVERYYR